LIVGVVEMPSRERVAVVVIRAWLEAGADQPFRARMTARLDLEAGQERVAAAASIKQVTVQVERWLKELWEDST
jgi:hypothetical protein